VSDTDSKLLPPIEQPALPGLPAPSFFAELESKGEFTGDRLFQQRPDTYKAVVVLLGQGLGVIRIGKLLSVSPNTVLAVRKREGASIDVVKQHLAAVAHDGAALASEAIVEALNNIAPNAKNLGVKELKELAVVYGILVQNGQLLAGQPTARLELSEAQKPQHEDFNRYLASLPTIDIAEADSTGLAGEKSGVKEPGLLAAAAEPRPGSVESELSDPGLAPVRIDEQSVGKPLNP
jgi:hypothetical protein